MNGIRQRTAGQQRGFTIIELMLAMAFITFILMFVVTSIVQLMGIYNKGLTLKSANQAGRTVSAEMQRSFQAAKPSGIDLSRINAGRICTGVYSYAWTNNNQPPAPAQLNRYSDSSPITFARIYDTGRQVCSAGATIPAALKPGATELISPNLQVRSLRVASTDAVTEPGLYKLSMTLSSQDVSLISYDVPSGTFACRVDDQVGQQYCSVLDLSFYAGAKN